MKTLKQWYTELFPYINKPAPGGVINKEFLKWLDRTDLKLKKKHEHKPKKLKLL